MDSVVLAALGTCLLGVENETQRSGLAWKHPAAGTEGVAQLLQSLRRARFSLVAPQFLGRQLRGVTLALRTQSKGCGAHTGQRLDQVIYLHSTDHQRQGEQAALAGRARPSRVQRQDRLSSLLFHEKLRGVHSRG